MAPKPGGGAVERKRGRTAKACVQCRATKTRCTFLGASTTCDKCMQRGLTCSMLPPGQRVSARERSPPQAQSPSKNAADAPSEHSSHPHVQQSAGAKLNSDLPLHTADHDGPDIGAASGLAEKSRATPQWPHSTPSQQLTDPSHWFGASPATEFPNEMAGPSMGNLQDTNRRNSVTQLHSLAASSSAPMNAIHPPHYASVVGPTNAADSMHKNVHAAHLQFQHQHQQQAAQFQRTQPLESQYQPSQQQQYQPHEQKFHGHDAFRNQGYQQQPYHHQLDTPRGSVPSVVSPQSYAPSAYLTSNHFHANRGPDRGVPLRPLMDNINIVQSIMRTENMSQAIAPETPSQQPQDYEEDLDHMPDHQLSSIDIRALMNHHSFTDPITLDPPPLMETEVDNFFGGNEFLGTQPQDSLEEVVGANDGSKMDDQLAENSLQPNEEILRSILESKNRFRYQTSPEYAALQFVDPPLRARLGQASKLLRAQPRVTTRHLLTIGLLSRNQAVTLVTFFRNNFNHWVGLPTEPDVSTLLDSLLNKCPLLVTAACCVALRLCRRGAWMRFYPVLVNFLHAEFAATLLESPQNLQFIQAIAIMALYADSLSYNEYVFDGWYLSGLGIQQLVTLAALTSSLTHVHLRLWNHLCLVNLSCANMTGRHTVVTDDAAQVCYRILVEPQVDRFDSCVVAEIDVCRSAFRYFSFQCSYAEFENDIAEWKKKWSYLNFSLIQFVQPTYLFVSFVIRWTHMWRLERGLSPISQDGEFGAIMDPASLADGIVSAAAAASLSTDALVMEMKSLTSAVVYILDSIHELYFGCLSDLQHNVAFVATVMAMRIRDLIIHRDDQPQETKETLNETLRTTRRLADRLQESSRGPDFARVQSYALIRLLQNAHI